MEIWFNASCSKCRNALAIVEKAGKTFTLRSYLEDPPTAEELDAVLEKLGKEPWEICRMKEPIAGDLGLASLDHDRAKWIALMVKHPILIERPILLADDGTAVIGRTEEALSSLLQR